MKKHNFNKRTQLNQDIRLCFCSEPRSYPIRNKGFYCTKCGRKIQ